MRKLPTLPKPKKLPTTARRKATATAKPSNGSSIESHSYSAETGQLAVTYRGGRKYRYDKIDPDTAAGLDNSDSKGSYFYASIIGKFPHTKI